MTKVRRPKKSANLSARVRERHKAFIRDVAIEGGLTEAEVVEGIIDIVTPWGPDGLGRIIRKVQDNQGS